MYKLIALDLDGTLTNDNKDILEETKNELNFQERELSLFLPLVDQQLVYLKKLMN